MTQLRTARQKANLSITQVATYLGTTVDKYDDIESHNVIWDEATLEKLAMLYGVSINALLTHPPHKLVVRRYSKNMVPEFINMSAKFNKFYLDATGVNNQ